MCTYAIIFVLFFPVNLIYVNLILTPATEPGRVEGKFFLPLPTTSLSSHLGAQKKMYNNL